MKRGIVAVVICVLIGSGAVAAAESIPQSSGTQQTNTDVTVKVDFGTSIPEKSMVGFLDSFTETAPPDSMILPLRPRFMRNPGWGAKGFENRIARAESLGMRTILVVSNAWKWSHHEMPFVNYSVWDSLVADLAKKFPDKNIIWDIWNEPTGELQRGLETTDQFLESFRRAHDVLRKQLGANVYIEGPSIGTWGNHFITIDQFMEYAKANHLKVDGLSWHEILGDESVPAVEDHLQYVRKKYLGNPDYASVGIKDIHINEIIGKYSTYYPGSIIAWFYFLEKGGADGACKACWQDDASGEITCGNSTLDGLLVPNTYAPRAGWWAYKYYADGVGSRVASTSSYGGIVALASKSGKNPNSAQILIGSYDPEKKKDYHASVGISFAHLGTLPFIANSKMVKVSVGRIPNSGLLPVRGIKTEFEKTIPVDGSVPVVIPEIKVHEMIVVTLSKS